MSLLVMAVETITWVKVERPVFDLVGVVLSSLGLAAVCAGVALSLGAVVGVGFIVKGRRAPGALDGRVALHLIEAPPR